MARLFTPDIEMVVGLVLGIWVIPYLYKMTVPR
jgi:hypothetical protein